MEFDAYKWRQATFDMLICTTFATLTNVLDFLKKNNVDYSISFEGYGYKTECKFKLSFKKEIDIFIFKLKYGDIVEYF